MKTTVNSIDVAEFKELSVPGFKTASGLGHGNIGFKYEYNPNIIHCGDPEKMGKKNRRRKRRQSKYGALNRCI